MILHAHPIELFWFAESLALVTWLTFSTRKAMAMSLYLKVNQINGLLQIASDNITKQEQLRLMVSVVMLLASGFCLVLEPPPPDFQPRSQQTVVFLAWALVGLIMLTQSSFNYAANQRLAEYQPEKK